MVDRLARITIMVIDFVSVEEFGTFLLDEGRSTFTFEEAEGLAATLGQSVATLVIRELKSYGFTMVAREVPRHFRGFRTSSNDRFFGPGSSKSHGGSGWEQINGLAGQEG
jgi:hypothetical protein